MTSATPASSESGCASSAARRPFDPGALLFGGDYNPDQWPREI